MKKNDSNKSEKSFSSSSINWYPGHMVKAKREIKEKLSLIDIVYEVIDARMPISSKVIDLDDLIQDKKTDRILFEYKKKYPVVVLDLKNGKYTEIENLLNLTNKLLENINLERKKKGLKPRLFRALVVGAPNVGKSTLINRISRKNTLKTGNRAGITKGISWVRIGNTIELLDTPGILYPKILSYEVGLNLACFSSINEDILDKEEIATYVLTYLYQNYKEILIERYQLDKDIEFNLENLFTNIAKNTSSYKKGNLIDYDKVYTIILNDLKEGRIKNVTFDNIDNKKE